MPRLAIAQIRPRKGEYAANLQLIGGVLAHLPGLLALTCASPNSYRRLLPHFRPFLQHFAAALAELLHRKQLFRGLRTGEVDDPIRRRSG